MSTRKIHAPVTFQLNSKTGDTYELRVRQVAPDKGANAAIDEDSGTILVKTDLMSGTGGLYEFLPGTEMDDTRIFILSVGITVAVTASVTQHRGKPDEDSNSASTVIHIANGSSLKPGAISASAPNEFGTNIPSTATPSGNRVRQT